MKHQVQKLSAEQALVEFQGIRILNLHSVREKTSLSKTAIYTLIGAGKFPRPVSLSDGGKKVGWVQGEIDEYLLSRIAARDARAK